MRPTFGATIQLCMRCLLLPTPAATSTSTSSCPTTPATTRPATHYPTTPPTSSSRVLLPLFRHVRLLGFQWRV